MGKAFEGGMLRNCESYPQDGRAATSHSKAADCAPLARAPETLPRTPQPVLYEHNTTHSVAASHSRRFRSPRHSPSRQSAVATPQANHPESMGAGRLRDSFGAKPL